MAWNDPPGNNNDPWGNRGDQGPPDLDEAIKKLQGQLSGIFGGKKDGSGPTGSNPFSAKMFGILLPVLAVFYLYISTLSIPPSLLKRVFITLPFYPPSQR